MTFKIEYGEHSFRVIAPNGDYDEARSFDDVSTVEFGGKVYGAFLDGLEAEVDPGPDKPNLLDSTCPRAKVYDLTNWPTLVPVDTITESVAFDDEEDDEPEQDVIQI